MSWNPFILLYGYDAAAWTILIVTAIVVVLVAVNSRHRLKGWLKVLVHDLGLSPSTKAPAKAGDTGSKPVEQLTIVLQGEGEILQQLQRLNAGLTQLINEEGQHHNSAQNQRLALNKHINELTLKFEAAQREWQRVSAFLLKRQAGGANEIAENTNNVTTPKPLQHKQQPKQPATTAGASKPQTISPTQATSQLEAGDTKPLPEPPLAPEPSTPPPEATAASPEDGASQPPPSPPPQEPEPPDPAAISESEEMLRKFISDNYDRIDRNAKTGRSGIEKFVEGTPVKAHIPANAVFILAPRNLTQHSPGRAYVFPGELLTAPHRDWFITEGKELNLPVRGTYQPAIVRYLGDDNWEVVAQGSFEQ